MGIKVFILFFISFSTFACELTGPIISLSGPMTILIEEIGLLEDKNLKAVSAFHPLKKKTSAQILAGGLFLSNKVLKQYQHMYFFFDKSRELKQILHKAKVKNFKEVNSVGVDNFDLIKALTLELRNHTEGCEQKFNDLELKLSNLKTSLLKSWKHKKIVFFLGKISSKLPELVMVNDGAMLFLKQHQLTKTYPSELAYVSWSQKELRKLKEYIFLGVQESKEYKPKLEKVSTNRWNIYYQGSLTPGISQIYFLNYLNSLSFH